MLGPWSIDKKVYPWRYPLECPFVTSCPRHTSPPIKFSGGFSKTRCAPSLSLIPLCSVQTISMVNSLEALVLYAVPLSVLFDLLQAVWHLPLRKPCVSALFRRSSTDELTRLSHTLPWDHPIARTLDHEVHRCKMAGKSYRFFVARPGVHSFPHTFFSWFEVVFPDLNFRRTVLWPIHLCVCPRRCRLNWAARFWVPKCSCRCFY